MAKATMSVGKIIILSFRAVTSQNKKISIIKVTYESNHISLLRDSTLSSVLNFKSSKKK